MCMCKVMAEPRYLCQEHVIINKGLQQSKVMAEPRYLGQEHVLRNTIGLTHSWTVNVHRY